LPAARAARASPTAWSHFVGTLAAKAREGADNSRIATIATVTSIDFPPPSVRPSRDILTGGVGLTIKCQDDVPFYATHDAIIRTGNTRDQTVSAGLRIHF
jgi:hypothetical protein